MAPIVAGFELLSAAPGNLGRVPAAHIRAHALDRCTVDSVNETIVRVVAHQGGWDEIVLVAGPLLALWLLLVLANRRAKRNRADDLENS